MRDQCSCVCNITFKDCTVEYIGQTPKPLKFRMSGEKRKKRPKDKVAPKRFERCSGTGPCSIAVGHICDCDDAGILQRGLPSHTEGLRAEDLVIGSHPTRLKRNDAAYHKYVDDTNSISD